MQFILNTSVDIGYVCLYACVCECAYVCTYVCSHFPIKMTKASEMTGTEQAYSVFIQHTLLCIFYVFSSVSH